MSSRKAPFDHKKAAALLVLAKRNVAEVQRMVWASFPVRSREARTVTRISYEVQSLRMQLQDGQASGAADVHYFGIDPSGLSGKYVHTFVEGRLQGQGQIRHEADDVGESYLVQMFEWGMGEPTALRRFTKEFLLSDACKLCADREVWLESARRLNAEKIREGAVPT